MTYTFKEIRETKERLKELSQEFSTPEKYARVMLTAAAMIEQMEAALRYPQNVKPQ